MFQAAQSGNIPSKRAWNRGLIIASLQLIRTTPATFVGWLLGKQSNAAQDRTLVTLVICTSLRTFTHREDVRAWQQACTTSWSGRDRCARPTARIAQRCWQ